MRKMFLVVAAVAASVFAADDAALAAKKAAFQAQMQKKYYANTGGRVVKPGSGEGAVVFVNAQKKVPAEAVQKALDHMTITLMMRFEVKPRDAVAFEAFEGEAKKSGGAATVFVVDSATLPMSLVAYESGWAMVNVAKLAESPSEKLAERLEKEFTRTVALTCGLCCGMGGAALMKPVRKVEALDDCELPSERGNGMITGPIHKYMLNFGLTPVTVATYRKACSDGWAPKPKDDAQRALWESTQEKKERGPVNGIKILPKKSVK